MNVMARDPIVLGMDVGTSSAKVCAVDADGRVLGLESEGYPTVVPQPAWAEQNPDLWLPALGRACRRLLTRLGIEPGSVQALAVTSAAHIGVLLDKTGRPIRPVILWHDQRSQAEARALADEAGEEIFAIGNNWPTATWTLPHLAWIRRHDPDAWSRTQHILLSKDYVAFQMTGKMTTDPAAAVSALLLDAQTNNWSGRLCELAGISTTQLPDVLPISGQIGTLLPASAVTLGLAAGTRVFNGTMDSTAETFSAGVRREGECVIRLASAGGIHGISSPPRTHPKLISYPYPIAPFWLSQAGTNTCASAVAWACSLFTGEAETPDYAAWSALAERSPPGCNDLFFHPYLAGERCPYWDGDLRASFIGLGLHHSRSDLARAVYEGTTFALRDALGVLQERGFALSSVRLVGGGAKSRIWSEIVASVLNCPVQAAPLADSSTGAALLALVGLGVYAGPDAVPAAEATSDAPVYAPEPSLRGLYDEAFEHYRDIQTHMSAIFHSRSRRKRSARNEKEDKRNRKGEIREHR
jgi:xylulokinase